MTIPNPMAQRLVDFGATYTPATVSPGQDYWRLVSADGPDFSSGNVVVFVDVLGTAGQRLIGVPVDFSWADGKDTQRTEAKPGDPRQGVSFVLGAAGNAYGVKVADGLPSDSIAGLGLVAWEPHASFQLVFRLTVADAAPVPPPQPTGSVREAIRMARVWLDEAERLLT